MPTGPTATLASSTPSWRSASQRQVLVFDASGLIRNDDELSWGITAVVASAERKQTAKAGFETTCAI
jgi:hypothetical protein